MGRTEEREKGEGEERKCGRDKEETDIETQNKHHLSAWYLTA